MALFDFLKPKWKHSNWKIRREAVIKLEDQDKLAEIAKNEKNKNVRWEAVRRLDADKWQELLLDISLNDYYYNAGEAAVKKIENQESLMMIAKKARESSVREAAVKKFQSEHLESFLLSCHPIKSLKTIKGWHTALEAYIKLKITPPNELLKTLDEINNQTTFKLPWEYRFDFGKLKETAESVLRRYPVEIDIKQLLLKVKEGSLDEKKAALKKIMWEKSASDEEVIDVLIQAASDKTLAETQENVIRYLGRLGAKAKSALEPLRSIYSDASRPVTMNDFREQQRLAGDASSLMVSIREKVRRGDPVSPGLMRVTKEAIESIENAK